MYKTAVYTLAANCDMHVTDTSKTGKNHKKVILRYAPSHRLAVNMLLNNFLSIGGGVSDLRVRGVEFCHSPLT